MVIHHLLTDEMILQEVQSPKKRKKETYIYKPFIEIINYDPIYNDRRGQFIAHTFACFFNGK